VLGGRELSKRRPFIERLEPRVVLDSTVVFNEIMYHPETNETRDVHDSSGKTVVVGGRCVVCSGGLRCPNSTLCYRYFVVIVLIQLARSVVYFAWSWKRVFQTCLTDKL